MNNKTNETQETPEVMSSSDSPSSYGTMAQNYDDWQDVLSSSEPPSISIDWSQEDIEYIAQDNDSTCEYLDVKAYTHVWRDAASKRWICRLSAAVGKTPIEIYTQGFRHADTDPPTNEYESISAVDTLNRYLGEGKGGWHTVGASESHERFHRTQMIDAANYYWKKNRIQAQINAVSFPLDDNQASSKIDKAVDDIMKSFNDIVWAYFVSLPDKPGVADNYAYRAGQAALNNTTMTIQSKAYANSWYGVSSYITDPGNYSPPCFRPPVNEMYARSTSSLKDEPIHHFMEDSMTTNIRMRVENPQELQEYPLRVSFHNNGKETVRLLDKFTPRLIWKVFFDVVLRNNQGEILVESLARTVITFGCNLNYLNIRSGESLEIAVPLNELIGKQCPDGLPTGEYTLTLTYHNRYGNDCIHGSIQTDENVII